MHFMDIVHKYLSSQLLRNRKAVDARRQKAALATVNEVADANRPVAQVILVRMQPQPLLLDQMLNG
jgi:hypothetical protein